MSIVTRAALLIKSYGWVLAHTSKSPFSSVIDSLRGADFQKTPGINRNRSHREPSEQKIRSKRNKSKWDVHLAYCSVQHPAGAWKSSRWCISSVCSLLSRYCLSVCIIHQSAPALCCLTPWLGAVPWVLIGKWSDRNPASDPPFPSVSQYCCPEPMS